jgi:NADH-quinone oxidoreductase subunit M
VAHMGFVLLGVASLTAVGLQGALFANVAHGLVTGLLFLVAGALKDRHHSADLTIVGPDLRDRLPRLGWLLAFGALAGLGLPGLAGFWGELLAIAGAWSSTALGPLGRTLAVLAAIGTAVAAAYLLRVLRLVWHGPLPTPGGGARPADAPPVVRPADARIGAGLGGVPGGGLPGVPAPVTIGDATGHEVSVTGPLVVAVAVLGVLPWLLLDVTGPAVRSLLQLTSGGVP